MANDMPQDPMTELAAGAHQLHELYRSYVGAGFTEQQAMTLVCTLIQGAQAAGGAA
jgi:hypothetical protein